MSLTPINIAFALPPEVNAIVKELNDKTEITRGIDFNTSVPHISVWMGFVKTASLPKIQEVFAELELKMSATLKVKSFGIFEGVAGSVLSIEFKPHPILNMVHSIVYNNFEEYRCKAATYNGLDKNSIDYLNDFGKHQSLQNYVPHITVGFSDTIPTESIPEFTISHPELFRVGAHVVCLPF